MRDWPSEQESWQREREHRLALEAEIARLRADNALLQEQLREWHGHATADELARLRAEVERLTVRHRIDGMADIKDQIIAGHVDNFMKQEAEIARLRHEVGHLDDQIQTLLRENESYRADVNRLTITLRNIALGGADMGGALCQAQAYAALAADGKCEMCQGSGVVRKSNEVWSDVYWCECPIGQAGKRREAPPVSGKA